MITDHTDEIGGLLSSIAADMTSIPLTRVWPFFLLSGFHRKEWPR